MVIQMIIIYEHVNEFYSMGGRTFLLCRKASFASICKVNITDL